MLIWLEKVEHYKLKNTKILKSYLKMEKTVIKFGDIEIQKQKFHQPKGPNSIKNADIDDIVVSNRVFFGKKAFKYFIGYKDAKN